MIQQFVDREAELRFLESKYLETSPQLIIVYGRRRVGKTELIKKFFQKKEGIYLLCTRDSLQENIKEMKRKFYEFTGKEYFLKLDTNSFFDLFKYAVEEIKDRKIIIIFDEFPYLIELQKGIISVFQKIWDELLKQKKVFLLLCGSSIGMMETEVLGYKSPLYGRRTGEWKVEPFKFKDIKSMFKKFSLEELVKVWCVFGGTPFYLTQMNPNFSIEDNIKAKILRKGEVLYNEPRILLKEEFREPRTYTLILKYLSLGYNSQGELSSVTGIEKGNLSKYLSVLEETHLIEYILPFGQKKRGIYVLNDPFFNFWFRFVYPNLSDLEVGLVDEVFSRIEPQLNAYYGMMFEQLVMELIKSKEIKIPFSFDWVGKWWYKDKEIDILALNRETKDILFSECKWGENIDAKKIVKELKDKSKFVQWYNDKREEHYAIFAKTFKKKFKEPNVFLFNLKDLEGVLK
ncbi:ATP-binding protein [Candidatus Bathyarchaeota archaeon]|nr:ATP-binding protein [Candidatus Bathyarchaeota archaeon]